MLCSPSPHKPRRHALSIALSYVVGSSAELKIIPDPAEREREGAERGTTAGTGKGKGERGTGRTEAANVGRGKSVEEGAVPHSALVFLYGK